jgi:hypothetical protein
VSKRLIPRCTLFLLGDERDSNRAHFDLIRHLTFFLKFLFSNLFMNLFMKHMEKQIKDHNNQFGPKQADHVFRAARSGVKTSVPRFFFPFFGHVGWSYTTRKLFETQRVVLCKPISFRALICAVRLNWEMGTSRPGSGERSDTFFASTPIHLKA